MLQWSQHLFGQTSSPLFFWSFKCFHQFLFFPATKTNDTKHYQYDTEIYSQMFNKYTCSFQFLLNIKLKLQQIAKIRWLLMFSNNFYHASIYARAVLGVVILSVCHTLALRQNQVMHCGYFDTTRKGNHSSFLTLRAVSYTHLTLPTILRV